MTLNRQKKNAYIHLLDLLHSGVATNKILCPISEEIFVEILKQSDPATLLASSILIDDLSTGVALMFSEDRVQFEMLNFIRSTTKKVESLHSTNIFIWPKVSHILGVFHPSSDAFSSEQNLAIQKSFLDHMWTKTLTEMIGTIGMENILNMPKLNDISGEINKRKIEFSHENKSFKQLYLSEIGGTLDLYVPLLREMWSYLYEKETGFQPAKNDRDKIDPGKLFANLIYHTFKRNKIDTHLPSLVIEAGLHASVRHDTRRKFKANDLPDFRHAKAAIPYFDYFFTEHNLRDLVTRKNLRFDKKYSCEVLSDPVEAVKLVTKLIS